MSPADVPARPAPAPLPLPGAGHARSRLRAAWASDDANAAHAAGHELADGLAPDARLAWGAAVLALLASLAPVPIAGVERALAIAGNPTRWPEGHDLALALGARQRRATRAFGERSPRALLAGMAECVAQLAYAAAGGLAPFGGDPAARLTTLARAAVEGAHDPALEARTWRMLSAHLRDGATDEGEARGAHA
jgi:hypothetical protein